MRLHENQRRTLERVDEFGRLRERIVYEKDIIERLISPNGKFLARPRVILSRKLICLSRLLSISLG